jgi:hypothetical protein
MKRHISVLVGCLAMLLAVGAADAFELYQDTEIQPNASASGYYVIVNSYIELDDLYVNETHVVFGELASQYQGVWNYDTKAQLCAVAANCTLAQTDTVINLWFSNDFTPPDVNWIDPTSNGTEAPEKDYIEWNISSTENISTGYIEINGTNHSCSPTNASVDSYCFYNQTGLTSNQTSCALGYASDGSGNWNVTDEYICRNINYYVPPTPPPISGRWLVTLIFPLPGDDDQRTRIGMVRRW